MKSLVFVHGFLGSSPNWRPVLHRLKEDSFLADWELRCVDLLWHSRRPGPLNDSRWTLDALVDDLETQLPSSDFVALGHSFGLRPLLRLAARHPSKIVHLIAEDSCPQLSRQSFDFVHSILTQVPVPFTTRNEAREFCNLSFGHETALARFLFSNLGPQENGTYDWRFQVKPLERILKESFENPPWHEWREFKNGLTLMRGERSNFLDQSTALKACEERGAKPTTFIEIAEAGHWIHAEKKENFCCELIKILKSV